MPRISVVMSVYNARDFVRDAIVSILKQTYTDFEFIIVNDGSSDGSADIIEELATTDARIRVISRENRGLVASLNEGIAMAQGEYIARMDADDISLPTRFAMQMAAMASLGVDVLGGAIRHLGGTEDGRVERYPVRDVDVKFWMLIKSPLAHPAVMAKADLMRANPYSEQAVHGEDYELWTRLAVKGVRFANLADVCLMYRHQQGQISKRSSEMQFQVASNAAAVYGQRMYGLTQDLMREMRLGMRREKIAAEQVLAWSLALTKVAKQNEVAPEWLRSVLFALARRSESCGLKLFRGRRQIAAIEPRALDRRLSLLYLSKALPFSNASWVIELLKGARRSMQ